MGDILTLVSKLERAKRNRTGFTVTVDELDALFEEDAIDGIYAAKLRKLKDQCPKKPALTSSETFGSTSGETVRPPRSGRSPNQPLDRSSIAALGRRA